MQIGLTFLVRAYPALVSPDGVAPSWMVDVPASVNLPLHYKVQKFWMDEDATWY